MNAVLPIFSFFYFNLIFVEMISSTSNCTGDFIPIRQLIALKNYFPRPENINFLWMLPLNIRLLFDMTVVIVIMKTFQHDPVIHNSWKQRSHRIKICHKHSLQDSLLQLKLPTRPLHNFGENKGSFFLTKYSVKNLRFHKYISRISNWRKPWPKIISGSSPNFASNIKQI